MKLPKIDVIYIFTVLLLFKIFDPAQFDNHWGIILLPVTLWFIDFVIDIPINIIKRKLKSRKAKIEDKARWNQRMEELQREHPKKPMKFNR